MCQTGGKAGGKGGFAESERSAERGQRGAGKGIRGGEREGIQGEGVGVCVGGEGGVGWGPCHYPGDWLLGGGMSGDESNT